MLDILYTRSGAIVAIVAIIVYGAYRIMELYQQGAHACPIPH